VAAGFPDDLAAETAGLHAGETEAAAPMLMIAFSMAEFTVRTGPLRGLAPFRCTRRANLFERMGKREKPWNQGNPNSADEGGDKPECRF
jgi:hypothetical protein